MNQQRSILSLFVAGALLGGCSPATFEAAGPQPDDRQTKALFVGIDGVRGDGVSGSATPHLDQLMGEGAWTLEASTQMEAQTVSGPGWSSMLTGVDSDKHGILANGGWENFDREYPTLIGRAHSLGLPTATAINWLPIQANIIEEQVTNEVILGDDETIATGMTSLLSEGAFDVFFVALDDVDRTGHTAGFSPEVPAYVAAIERADEQVGAMLAAIASRSTRSDESWIVVVTSDHGGVGLSHGGITAEHRAIPFIVWGDSVVPGKFSGGGSPPGELDAGFISHMDVHPTVMEHLGHPVLADWDLDGIARGLN